MKMQDYFDNGKDFIKNLNIKDPSSCIQFIRKIAGKWFDTLKSYSQMGDIIKANEEYEKLLQKSELKIRDFIRVSIRKNKGKLNIVQNEHIYRISFDQFVTKCEESDKLITELETKLEEKMILIDVRVLSFFYYILFQGVNERKTQVKINNPDTRGTNPFLISKEGGSKL